MHPSSKILVINDDPNLCRTLSLIFQSAGYCVALAATPKEALKILESDHFDLVFVDMEITREVDRQLLVDIQRKDPRLPVLLLTAQTADESLVEAIHLGAWDYLVKPVDPTQILSRAREILAANDRRRQGLDPDRLN